MRAIAFAKFDESSRLFADFEFVSATFAAQAGWQAAAEYRDLALRLEPGTSEVEKGIQPRNASDCAEPATAAATPAYDSGIAPRASSAGVAVAPEHLPGADPAEPVVAGAADGAPAAARPSSVAPMTPLSRTNGHGPTREQVPMTVAFLSLAGAWLAVVATRRRLRASG